MIPIWQDYFVPLGTAVSRAFTVALNGVTVYSGTAYSPTGASDALRVNITPIARDYMAAMYANPDMTAQGGRSAITEPVTADFTVTPSGGSAVTVSYYWDWSYLDIVDNTAVTLRNEPINGHITAAQGLFLTRHNTAVGNSVVLFINGAPDGQHGQGDNVTFSFGQSDTTVWYGAGSGLFQDATHGTTWGLDTDSGQALRTPTGRWLLGRFLDDCEARWALDYENAFGGWDSFLIEGAWKRIDDYDRKRMRTGQSQADMANVVDRARRDNTEYANIVTPRWELHTGLLTEEEAGRMHHLIGSPQVFLRDLTEAREYSGVAVLVTDTACEYKRNGTGGWACEYTINVEQSQRQMRR